MHFKLRNRALLRSITVSAVLLGAASACSKSDKTSSSGSTEEAQTGAATSADTQSIASQPTTATRPSSADTTQVSDSSAIKPSASAKTPQASKSRRSETGVPGYQAMGRDTSADTGSASRDTVTVGDSAHIGKTGNRLEPTQTSERVNTDTLTDQNDSVRIRPPEDSSETVGVTTSDTGRAAVSGGDTVAVDSSAVSTEMARDTTTALGQADTTAPSDTTAQVTADTSAVQAQVDTTQQTEMAQQAPVDTTAIQAKVDTTQAQADTSSAAQQTEMAQAPADTAAVAPADTAAAQPPKEPASESDRIRPTEDSTEVLGNVTDQKSKAEAAPAKVEADAAAVGAAGVPTTGNTITGAEAVALMTRQGQRCSVVADPAERRDLASSPATVNPCGTGTMTLPRVEVEK
jgi:hypothetical protein